MSHTLLTCLPSSYIWLAFVWKWFPTECTSTINSFEIQNSTKSQKKNHLKIEKSFLKEKDVINLYRKNWNYKIEFKLQQFIMKKCTFRMRKGKWEIFALKQLSNVCTNCNQILNIFKILIPHFMYLSRGTLYLLQNGMDDTYVVMNFLEIFFCLNPNQLTCWAL